MTEARYTQQQDQKSDLVKELQSLLRSLTRSLIFGIAFVYTMEAWWIGTYLSIGRLLGFFFISLIASIFLIPITSDGGLNTTVGRVIREAVRNKGIALLVAALLLELMKQITLTDPPFTRDLATVVLLSIPISLGADVAKILSVYGTSGPTSAEKQQEGKDDEQKNEKSDKSEGDNPWVAVLKDIGAIVGGTLFVALPVAPTEEIPMLAARMGIWRELGVVVLSLLISYMMIYATGSSHAPPSGDHSKGAAIWPYADTLLSYGTSLVVSLVVLFLLGRVTAATPPNAILSLVVVLGLPATIGGSAGKLVL